MALRWLRIWRRGLLLGLGLWVLIAVAATLYARRTGSPVWESVVTWDEWVTAVLLIPWLMGTARGLTKRQGSASRDRRQVGLYMVAAGVFGLDLLTRAVLGMGWQPFF